MQHKTLNYEEQSSNLSATKTNKVKKTKTIKESEEKCILKYPKTLTERIGIYFRILK